jgi:glycosyltransferase involved in cell wall biosynthesis
MPSSGLEISSVVLTRFKVENSDMRKLRIAILAPIHWRTPPYKQGAWELVASNITEELVRRGHDVTLFATADSITKAKLRWVAPSPLLEPAGSVLEFDIVHNHFDGYPLAFSKLVKTPVVTTVHGFSSPQIKDLYMRYSQSYYVSISQADRRHCPEMNWIANIHHGIDFKDLPFSATHDDYFVFLGRVHPTKGTHLAIQAAKKANVTLRIAAHIDKNDPIVRTYWEQECLPYIDGDQIVFVGEVGPKGKSELLRGAVATLCPIQWAEPFGLVFVESMASGTPVIAYGSGSAPEIIKDKVGGIIVEPNDMEAFVESIKTVRELDRHLVREYAEKAFSIEHMVDQYEQVYTQILDKA